MWQYETIRSEYWPLRVETRVPYPKPFRRVNPDPPAKNVREKLEFMHANPVKRKLVLLVRCHAYGAG